MNKNTFVLRILPTVTGMVLGALGVMLVLDRCETAPVPDRPCVTVVHDTIDVGYCCAPSGRVYGGLYMERSKTAIVRILRDTLGTERSATIARNLNLQFKYVDYHELRHGYNHWLEMQGAGHPNVRHFALDEISARCAAFLARSGDMPPLGDGQYWADINYTVTTGASLRNLADSALNQALYQVQVNGYHQDFLARVNNAKKYRYPRAEFNAIRLEAELMTFRINGRSVSLLDAASDTTRRKLAVYLRDLPVR